MNSIIAFLIQFNQTLLVKIEELLLIIEELSPKKKDFDPKSPKYKRFSVDKPPLLAPVIQKQDYRKLLQEADLSGKTIKPVKSRGIKSVPDSIQCLYCDAPHSYIYDNSGGRGQFLCKVCHSTFFVSEKFVQPSGFYCPYCNCLLSKIKERKGFFIHRCPSKNVLFTKTLFQPFPKMINWNTNNIGQGLNFTTYTESLRQIFSLWT